MSGRELFARICGLTLISLAQFRVFFSIHHEGLYELGVAAQEVTLGTPHWRAFQNRLLGPYAVAAWSAVTGQSYTAAHTLFLIVITVITNLTAFFVFRRLTHSADVAFRYTVYLAAAFVALMVTDWVFVWDFVEMPIFLLFAYGVFTRQPWPFFVPLLVIGLLNRESALFIAAWVAISALARRRPAQVWVGVAMMAACVVYIIAVRNAWFLHSSLQGTSRFMEIPVVGNQFNLVESARRAAIHLLNPAIDMVFVVHLGYLAFVAYFTWHGRVVRERHLDQFVLVAAMLAAVPLFGFFDETRQYAYLIPMLLTFNLALHDKVVGVHQDPDLARVNPSNRNV